MTSLAVVAIVLASTAAYLLAGWRLAMKHLPQSWAKARKDWRTEENQRMSVRGQTASMFLFWPIVMIVHFASARLDVAIDSGDPITLARKLAERERYIAQLEREAGIRS